MKAVTTIRLGSILVIVSAILLSSSRQAVMQSGKTEQKPKAPVASPQQPAAIPGPVDTPCDALVTTAMNNSGCGGGGEDPGGGGGGTGGGGGGSIGGGGGSTGDGHIWCEGWDTQGDCAFNHLGVIGGATFLRQRGNNGYDFQTFLTWNTAEVGGRFPISDGNVGLISTSPLTGQVPLHRWTTRKGFYYSIYFAQHGGDYVYAGIAGYVWPAGDVRGFPLYQFYSQEYGHFYTNYPRNEISCQPDVNWAFQGAMARVNWPAPAIQATRSCRSFGPFPPACNPFGSAACMAQGRFFDFNSCVCL